MKEDLKPCPFCGKSDKVTIYTNSMAYHGELLWICYGVKCKRCRFAIPTYAKKAAAIRKWNTRPAEDALKAEVDRLKGALLQIEYFRDLNPDLHATDYVVDVESELKNFYCKMGDIAKAALADSDEQKKGGEDE